MSFDKYCHLESPIYACRLTRETQQEIADEISSSATLGKLADMTVKLNDLNGCQEYTFRYMNDTATVSLAMNDWLVRMPDGTLRVYHPEEFSKTFRNGVVDYYIPEDHQKNFSQALLELVNSSFPELYLDNVKPVFKPYVNLVPSAAAAVTPGFQVTIDGSTIYLQPDTSTDKTGAALAGTKVSLKLAKPEKITKYLISMDGDSYNAPKSWKVTAKNSQDGSSMVISTITAEDRKPGYYTPDAFIADEFEFEFGAFEMDGYRVKGFRLAVTKGGEYAEAPEPQPFTEFTPEILAQVAEKLSVWYSVADDRYTISLPTRGITSMAGLKEILPTLMKASFIKPTTTVVFNLTNNEITDTRYPNQFDYPALQAFSYELSFLKEDLRSRITEINFTSTAEGAPSAVAKSVTFNTTALWNDFVDSIIRLTGIQQPGEIRK